MNRRYSTLWLFATLNYLYCDVVTLMSPDLLKQFLAGNVGGIDVTQGFLLGAALLVEIPMAMVLLSRVLNPRANRLANVTAGLIMSVVQLSSLFVRVPAPYYLFFSIIEIGTTAFITWQALKWRVGDMRESLVTSRALLVPTWIGQPAVVAEVDDPVTAR